MPIKRVLPALSRFALLTLSAGCTVWADIKPSELPKISTITVAPAVSQTTGRSEVLAMSIARVERTDGRVLEVLGRPDARVSCRGQERVYEHPVVSTLEGQTMTISSANYAKTTCELSDLSSVQVVDVAASNTRSRILYLTLPPVVMLATYGVTLAVLRP